MSQLLQFGHWTDPGPREQNQDSGGAYFAGSAASGIVLAYVADGMGGMEAGEEASAAAGRAVERATAVTRDQIARPEAQAGFTIELSRAANEEVLAALAGRSGGTTFTAISAVDDRVAIAHVGDSRAYFFGGGRVFQLTKDHSLVAALVATGQMSPEDAEVSPDRNKILRSLGTAQSGEIGYADDLAVTGVMGDASTFVLGPGEGIVILSDGVWGALRTAGIAEFLSDPNILQFSETEIARALVTAALRLNTDDNATAVVVRRAVAVGHAGAATRRIDTPRRGNDTVDLSGQAEPMFDLERVLAAANAPSASPPGPPLPPSAGAASRPVPVSAAEPPRRRRGLLIGIAAAVASLVAGGAAVVARRGGTADTTAIAATIAADTVVGTTHTITSTDDTTSVESTAVAEDSSGSAGFDRTVARRLRISPSGTQVGLFEKDSAILYDINSGEQLSPVYTRHEAWPYWARSTTGDYEVRWVNDEPDLVDVVSTLTGYATLKHRKPDHLLLDDIEIKLRIGSTFPAIGKGGVSLIDKTHLSLVDTQGTIRAYELFGDGGWDETPLGPVIGDSPERALSPVVWLKNHLRYAYRTILDEQVCRGEPCTWTTRRGIRICERETSTSVFDCSKKESGFYQALTWYDDGTLAYVDADGLQRFGSTKVTLATSLAATTVPNGTWRITNTTGRFTVTTADPKATSTAKATTSAPTATTAAPVTVTTAPVTSAPATTTATDAPVSDGSSGVENAGRSERQ